MSADNWTECPKCLMIEEAKKNALKLKAESEYGKIPRAEYLELVRRSEEQLNTEQTLREDYEFWTDQSGEFSANYICHCEVCGLEHTFKHVEQLKI